MSTNAVIFAQPADQMMVKVGICSQYCIEAGYEAIAIVRGAWDEAMDYIASGDADVIVAAEDDDLPPDRTPRIEVVTHMREVMLDTHRHRSDGPADDARYRRPRPLA
jgi:hypothetical protein